MKKLLSLLLFSFLFLSFVSAGTPKIISCVPIQNINSGDTTNPALSVQNIGGIAGSFYGNVQCTGGASGIISENYFDTGETKNIPIQITGQNTNTGTITSSCTATVIDRKGGGQDTCNFNVNIKYESGLGLQACPFQCCVGDSRYVDRLCSSDKPYCIQGSCSYLATSQCDVLPCQTGNSILTIGIGMLIVIGIIIIVILVKKKKK